MFLAWLISNWKGVVLFAMIAAVAGYIWFLQADVRRHEAEATALQTDVATLKKNLAATENAIKAMGEGMRTFRSLVDQAIESSKATQRQITDQNWLLQRALDNVAFLAAKAQRILDAPIIPFFLPTDNSVRGGAALIGVDNGVHHYRLLPPGGS